MTASTEVITLSSSPPRERLSPRKSRFLPPCTSDQDRLSQHAVQRQAPRYRFYSGSLTFPNTAAASSGFQTAREYSTSHTCTVFHQANARASVAGSEDQDGSTKITVTRSKFNKTAKYARQAQRERSPAFRTNLGQSGESPVRQGSETRSPVLLRELYRKSSGDVSPSARFDASPNTGSPTPSPRSKFMLSKAKPSADPENTIEESLAATNACPTTNAGDFKASESPPTIIHSLVGQVDPTGSTEHPLGLTGKNEGIFEGSSHQSRQQEAVPLQDTTAGLDAPTSLTCGKSRSQVTGAEQAPDCLATAVPTKTLPANTKKPAKSSRTVTGIVLAAYRGQESSNTRQPEKACDSTVAFFRSDNVDNHAHSWQIDNVVQDIDVKPHKPVPESKKRRRKPSTTTRKHGRSRLDLPPLPPPEVALEHLREQQWLFGTSSQLVDEEKSARQSDANEAGAPLASNSHKGVSSTSMSSLEPPSALWEAATFVDGETNYLGGTPIAKPQALASSTFGSQNLSPLRTGPPTAENHINRLSMASYKRVKPPLLCAASLLQTATTLTRLPLSDVPANNQIMRSISSLNKRAALRRGGQDTAGDGETVKVILSKRKKTKDSKVSLAVKEPQKDGCLKKPRGRPRGKKTEDNSSTVKAKPVPQAKRGRAATSTPPATPRHHNDDQTTLDSDGFDYIDEPSPEAAEQVSSALLASRGTDPPERASSGKKHSKHCPQARRRLALSVIEGDKLEALKAEVFPIVTQAIISCQPSNDPTSPSWYEKILLYDPIVLEDLTDWLNSRSLKDIDRSLQPSEVQKWCEYNSICCIWREGLRGGIKLLY